MGILEADADANADNVLAAADGDDADDEDEDEDDCRFAPAPPLSTVNRNAAADSCAADTGSGNSRERGVRGSAVGM